MNLQTLKKAGIFVLVVSSVWSASLYAGPDVQALKEYRSRATAQADRTVDDPQCQKIPSNHLRPKSLRAWRIPKDCRKAASYDDAKKHQHLRVKGIPIS